MSAEADSGAVAALVERYGLAVFPLPPGGRRPQASGWQHACCTTADEVRRHWRPGANIGIGCRASRIVGLDLDQEDDGTRRFATLCAARGRPWPHTFTVATPSGGRHLYFRAPPGRTVVSSSGGITRLGPGIDVRAPGRRSGGYLIGPGSVVSGVPYTVVRDTKIAPLPSWLRELLNPSHRLTKRTTSMRRVPSDHER
ncbi:bifunctional DNA primase/polymerase [Streptomyces sp. TR02-1]|uniref:bifunctional DNA primase/polymerase n=1 Tax=Streptomyces sp. TR02-1 TaxID=3385977 RepID=UPI00399F750C